MVAIDRLRKKLKQSISLLVLISFLPLQVFAEDSDPEFSLSKEAPSTRAGQNGNGGGGGEYVSGDYPGATLMKINLWGAVNRTGMHFVPVQTDLVSLLSYAGGPATNAKLNEVLIRRWTLGKEHVYKVDLDKLVHEVGTPFPVIKANDVIYIPVKTPLISPDTIAVVGMVTSVLSVFTVILLLVRQ